MALRKFYIVIDCEDDAQKTAVQNALNELSNARALTSRNIISMYPFFKKHQYELAELFNMIRTGGVKSLLSVRGGHVDKQPEKIKNFASWHV